MEDVMKRNVGGADRALRIGGGVVLLLLAWLMLPPGLRGAAIVLGAIALVSGLAAYCPIREALHSSTADSDTGQSPG
jgi:hypothetical protein